MVKNQLNLNTILIGLVGVLLAFGVNKMDSINTSVVRFQERIDTISEEIKQLRLADAQLRNELDALKRHP